MDATPPQSIATSRAARLNELRAINAAILEAFAEEATRLSDPDVLQAGGRVMIGHVDALERLGTRDHDLALQWIREQVVEIQKHARVSRRGVRESLREFGRAVRERLDVRRPRPMHDDLEHIASRAKSEANPELAQLYGEIGRNLEPFRDIDTHMANDNVAFRASLLAHDARLHIGSYTRLATYRTAAFVIRHTFMFTLTVLGLGVGFSWLARESSSAFAAFRPGFWWSFSVVLLFAILKQYVLADPLRRMQLRFETRLLYPVVGRVFEARVHGMLAEVGMRSHLREAYERSLARSAASETRKS